MSAAYLLRIDQARRTSSSHLDITTNAIVASRILELSY